MAVYRPRAGGPPSSPSRHVDAPPSAPARPARGGRRAPYQANRQRPPPCPCFGLRTSNRGQPPRRDNAPHQRSEQIPSPELASFPITRAKRRPPTQAPTPKPTRKQPYPTPVLPILAGTPNPQRFPAGGGARRGPPYRPSVRSRAPPGRRTRYAAAAFARFAGHGAPPANRVANPAGTHQGCRGSPRTSGGKGFVMPNHSVTCTATNCRGRCGAPFIPLGQCRCCGTTGLRLVTRSVCFLCHHLCAFALEDGCTLDRLTPAEKALATS